MSIKTISDRHHISSVVLHWLMLILFIAVYATINLRELYEKGSVPREALKSLHFMLGLLMFGIVWLRIFFKLKFKAPDITPTPPPLQEKAAKLAHLMLYAIMIGMPLMGWLLLSAAGKPIPFFGLNLPALIAPNKALASQIKELHELIGTIGYFLIGAHAMAALFHHYIKRDNTLRRMRIVA